MKSVVLLSGGLDSAVCLAHAVRDGTVVLALTFDYGQQAAKREIQAAAALARHYGVPHRVIYLPFLREITTAALITGEDLPEPEDAALDDPVQAAATARQVWVPNRNGIFLNIAAAFAEYLDATAVVAGFNREEAASFPDNSAAFVTAVTAALRYSTLNRVRVVSYTQHLNKTEIARLGMRLGVPLALVWSCYRGGAAVCGRCESCRRFSRALAAAREG
uniref:7-cyano-7-deazaguanine synthase n=1 Tax=Ammonifex degensii TaxID=42838 RepID=A0A7C2E2Q7_9THEO